MRPSLNRRSRGYTYNLLKTIHYTTAFNHCKEIHKSKDACSLTLKRVDATTFVLYENGYAYKRSFHKSIEGGRVREHLQKDWQILLQITSNI